MKATFIFASLLIFAGIAHADCVATSTQGQQICSMVTDQATCNQLQGICQWQGGGTGTPTGSCTGSSPMCTMLNSQQQCSQIPGCNWN